MKKLTLILALVLLATAAGAQTINIQNAIEQQNRGYLKKAKEYIDKACTHESTADNAKAWYYRTMIYVKIGDEIKKNTKKGKELVAVVPNWAHECMISALTWQKLDVKREFEQNISLAVTYVGSEYYQFALDAYNKEHDYAKAMAFCDTAIMLYGISGKENLPHAYYLAGGSAMNMENSAAAKNYFSKLVSSRNKTYPAAYEQLYKIYLDEKDTVNAVKTAKTFAQIAPDTVYQGDMLASKAYRLVGNIEKSQEHMNKALAKVRNDNEKAILLCAIGTNYDESGDYVQAEKCYKESLQIMPNQFIANNSMGLMFYNRAVDKLNASSEVDFDDEASVELGDKLAEESKDLFRQCIGYYVAAVNYLDGQSEEMKSRTQGSLINCLRALKNAYIRLEMNEEFLAVNKRIQAIEAKQ